MTLDHRVTRAARPFILALASALLIILSWQTSGYSSTTAAVHALANGKKHSTPPPASTAKVLAAVRAAEKIKQLPGDINAEVLLGLANDAYSAWSLPGCSPSDSATSLTAKQLSKCTYGATKFTHTLMVIGDSHAAMWLPAFSLMGERIGWRIIDLTEDNCGPASLHYYLYPQSREYSQCDAWQVWRTREINKIDPSIVVLTGYIGGNTGPSVPLTPAIWQAGIEKTIRLFRPGIRSVVLADMPHILKQGPECLAKNANNIQACSSPAASIVPTAYNQAEAAAATATGATYVDPTPWMCAQVCPDAINGIDVYVGIYHINHAYAAYLTGAMQAALQPLISSASS